MSDPESPAKHWEDAEDALVDGDRGVEAGTALSALRYRTFRSVFFGAAVSNIGKWMQTVVLGALAYDLTGSGWVVGLTIFAQLGPLLLLSAVGGMLADSVDRRKLLVALSIEQALFAGLLALVVADPDPSIGLILAAAFGVGIGNALYAPSFSALLPVLVPRRDISAAISLNSAQMNSARVIGPVIGTALFAAAGASWVFLANALSFFAVVAVFLRVPLPPPPASGSQGLHRLLEGVTYIRAHATERRCVLLMFAIALMCLPFITQMPTIAGENLGIDPRSSAYGVLYAVFGLGAVTGALSIGTLFSRTDKRHLTFGGLIGFGAALATFAMLRSPVPAYPVIFVVGTCYFLTVTSLSTTLQEALEDRVRGKVMAIWIMCFGGTAPLGGLLGGRLMDLVGPTPVVLFSAAVAVTLAMANRARPPQRDQVPQPALAD